KNSSISKDTQMINFSLSKLSNVKNPASTLVVFVHAKDKNFKAVDVSKELAVLVESFKNENLSASDLKKGQLFRNANVAGHQHILFIGRVEDKGLHDGEAVRRTAAAA